MCLYLVTIYQWVIIYEWVMSKTYKHQIQPKILRQYVCRNFFLICWLTFSFLFNFLTHSWIPKIFFVTSYFKSAFIYLEYMLGKSNNLYGFIRILFTLSLLTLFTLHISFPILAKFKYIQVLGNFQNMFTMLYCMFKYLKHIWIFN